MRPRVLAASMSLVLILSGRVVVQTIQNRPPHHDHPAFSVPGARQLAVKPFPTLPKGVLFLYETADDSFGLATNRHVQVGTTDF